MDKRGGRRERERERESTRERDHTHCVMTLMTAGTALIKPTSFLFPVTRTPQCHTFFQPGGMSAQRRNILL